MYETVCCGRPGAAKFKKEMTPVRRQNDLEENKLHKHMSNFLAIKTQYIFFSQNRPLSQKSVFSGSTFFHAGGQFEWRRKKWNLLLFSPNMKILRFEVEHKVKESHFCKKMEEFSHRRKQMCGIFWGCAIHVRYANLHLMAFSLAWQVRIANSDWLDIRVAKKVDNEKRNLKIWKQCCTKNQLFWYIHFQARFSQYSWLIYFSKYITCVTPD